MKNIGVKEDGCEKTDEAQIAGPVGEQPYALAEQVIKRALPEKHDDRGDDDRRRCLGKAFLFKCRTDGQQWQLRFYFMVFCETYLTISFFLILTTLKNLPYNKNATGNSAVTLSVSFSRRVRQRYGDIA